MTLISDSAESVFSTTAFFLMWMCDVCLYLDAVGCLFSFFDFTLCSNDTFHYAQLTNELFAVIVANIASEKWRSRFTGHKDILDWIFNHRSYMLQNKYEHTQTRVIKRTLSVWVWYLTETHSGISRPDLVNIIFIYTPLCFLKPFTDTVSVMAMETSPEDNLV